MERIYMIFQHWYGVYGYPPSEDRAFRSSSLPRTFVRITRTIQQGRASSGVPVAKPLRGIKKQPNTTNLAAAMLNQPIPQPAVSFKVPDTPLAADPQNINKIIEATGLAIGFRGEILINPTRRTKCRTLILAGTIDDDGIVEIEFTGTKPEKNWVDLMVTVMQTYKAITQEEISVKVFEGDGKIMQICIVEVAEDGSTRTYPKAPIKSAAATQFTSAN